MFGDRALLDGALQRSGHPGKLTENRPTFKHTIKVHHTRNAEWAHPDPDPTITIVMDQDRPFRSSSVVDTDRELS